jgi:hypothetical protein
MLKSLGVNDLDALEERTVNVGREEVKIDRDFNFSSFFLILMLKKGKR